MNAKLRTLALMLSCGSVYAAPPMVGPVDVFVTNDDTTPVSVKISDSNVPIRFQSERLMTIATNTVGRALSLFEVPVGKTAIVKFVSGQTFTDVDSWVNCSVVRMADESSPLGGGGSHTLLVQKRVRPPRFAGQVADFSHEFSQEMEFYVEGGRFAGFDCTMVPAPTNPSGAIVSLTMTGVLVEAQAGE